MCFTGTFSTEVHFLPHLNIFHKFTQSYVLLISLRGRWEPCSLLFPFKHRWYNKSIQSWSKSQLIQHPTEVTKIEVTEIHTYMTSKEQNHSCRVGFLGFFFFLNSHFYTIIAIEKKLCIIHLYLYKDMSHGRKAAVNVLMALHVK